MPIPAKRATLMIVGKPPSKFEVHFNPESLQYTITNTLKEGRGNQTKQYVTKSTGKLSMDLIFDTTHSGEDIRLYTNKVAALMEPEERRGSRRKFPPVVLFEWGEYSFQGMVESYQETIDLFASEGVPLRATVKLGLAQQDMVFERAVQPSVDTQGGGLDAVELPRQDTGDGGNGPGGPTRAEGQGDITETAARAGNPRAARAIASANAQESMRFFSGTSLSIDPTGVKAGAVGFGSTQAEGGVGAGVGLSAGIGSRASAGIRAAEGAFGGLRSQVTGAAPQAALDVSGLLPQPEPVGVGGEVGAAFALDGKAGLQGAVSLRAEVGASASLRSRIQFDES